MMNMNIVKKINQIKHVIINIFIFIKNKNNLFFSIFHNNMKNITNTNEISLSAILI